MKDKLEDSLDRLKPGLLKSALAGHTEICPLCDSVVLSVALHFVSCLMVAEQKEKSESPG
jgi:hypothetical protein